jgi:hypothetical protein
MDPIPTPIPTPIPVAPVDLVLTTLYDTAAALLGEFLIRWAPGGDMFALLSVPIWITLFGVLGIVVAFITLGTHRSWRAD